jgi:hypothetical protein
MLSIIKRYLSELAINQQKYRITLALICLYIFCIVLLLYVLHDRGSVACGVAVTVGLIVVCIPATDLDNSLREAKKFRDLLAKLPPDEFELFQKIVMRREFEAVLEDGGVLPDKPPDPPTSPPLYKLMSDTSVAGLSSRRPTKTVWRSNPSAVQVK